MDKYIPVEQLLGASEGSIYKLTVLAAKRAMEIANGDKPLVEKAEERFLDTAIQEINQDRVRVKTGKSD